MYSAAQGLQRAQPLLYAHTECCVSMLCSARQMALLHLKPEPNAICHTRSPRRTPPFVSMFASTYLRAHRTLSAHAVCTPMHTAVPLVILSTKLPIDQLEKPTQTGHVSLRDQFCWWHPLSQQTDACIFCAGTYACMHQSCLSHETQLHDFVFVVIKLCDYKFLALCTNIDTKGDFVNHCIGCCTPIAAERRPLHSD